MQHISKLVSVCLAKHQILIHLCLPSIAGQCGLLENTLLASPSLSFLSLSLNSPSKEDKNKNHIIWRSVKQAKDVLEYWKDTAWVQINKLSPQPVKSYKKKKPRPYNSCVILCYCFLNILFLVSFRVWCVTSFNKMSASPFWAMMNLPMNLQHHSGKSCYQFSPDEITGLQSFDLMCLNTRVQNIKAVKLYMCDVQYYTKI